MSHVPSVRVAGDAGFCFGVRKAVEAVGEALASGERVVALAPIVHNRHVMARLQDAGLRLAKSLQEVGADELLVVPSHGASVADLAAAAQRGIRVLDLTCPRVRRSQAAAAGFAAQGLPTLVIGDPGHAEVRSVLSYAGPGSQVLPDERAAAGLAPGGSWGVIAQTTAPIAAVESILATIAARSANLSVEPTTCQVAAGMQRTVQALARDVDIMIVVGGRSSANTANLASMAREQGAKTYHVEQASELDLARIAGVGRVGVAAGASTPDWLIEEVVTKVMEIEQRPGDPAAAPVDTQPAAGGTATAPEGGAPAGNAQRDGGKEEPSSMEDVRHLGPGDVVPGRVVEVRPGEGVMVDVGYKSEGLIPLSELARRSVPDPLSQVTVGEEILVQVLRIEGEEGHLILSKRRADEERTWGSLQAAFAAGTPVTGKATQAVKGGLLIDVGARAFLPASHVGTEFVRDLQPYVGREVTAKVIEIDRKDRKIILSERQYLEEHKQATADEIWSRIIEGSVMQGTVKRLTDFGAFVDLGGLDGLLHISELSWTRVNHPSEVVREGDRIDVKVLRVDRERNRISLGRKQLEGDPWSKAAQRLQVGSVVTGKVVRLVPFGAFVQLADGVDGLVHISQIADHRIAKPEEALRPGQEVRAKILSITPDTKRISLSIRDAEQDRHRTDYRSYLAQQPAGEVTVGEMLAARTAGEVRDEGDKPRR
jgi:4-hydroxy-3-methylbut-2-enyl diphosphate reductase